MAASPVTPSETKKPRQRTLPRPGQLSYQFLVLGGRRSGFRDAYHALLKMPWYGTVAVIIGAYLVVNTLFALGYLVVGGVSNMAPGSFADAFFFSIETLGTIGYGYMSPISRAANILMTCESVVGLLFTAVATGLVFVRFSKTHGRILFSDRAVISPIDGVPTLTVRLGNERRNIIYDAEFRLTLSRTQRTAEGHIIYRSEDLKLMRRRAPNLSQSWMILHQIDAQSPLYGQTPESLAQVDAELAVAVSGTDDTSLQPVHGRHTYEHFSVLWGMRLVDVLDETPEGNVILDLRRFHQVEPTTPTEAFPYPERPKQ
jgi:inward rectifier potassium channel